MVADALYLASYVFMLGGLLLTAAIKLAADGRRRSTTSGAGRPARLRAGFWRCATTAGFDVARTIRGLGLQHFGLSSMRERVEMAGGSFEINSTRATAPRSPRSWRCGEAAHPRLTTVAPAR
jgi:hypothetical protein